MGLARGSLETNDISPFLSPTPQAASTLGGAKVLWRLCPCPARGSSPAGLTLLESPGSSMGLVTLCLPVSRYSDRPFLFLLTMTSWHPSQPFPPWQHTWHFKNNFILYKFN